MKEKSTISYMGATELPTPTPPPRSRKWMLGSAAFILFVTLSILSANTSFILPKNTGNLLGLIALTWLVVEGFIDWKKISKILIKK